MNRLVVPVLILLSAAWQADAVVLINEIDCDQDPSDSVEFVELYNTEATPVNLGTGHYVIVIYNGAGDVEYNSLDLTGTIGALGYFVIGSSIVPNVDLSIGPLSNILQNGADAVAIFSGATAAQFELTSVNFPPVGAVLVDAVVYDTGQPDDAELLAALTPGQPQVNENQNGKGITESIQRIPDGAGGPRNTGSFLAGEPTPGEANFLADTTPPDVMLAFASGVNKISVFFTEPVAPTSAESPTNYELFNSSDTSLGNPASVVLGLGGRSAELAFGSVTSRAVYYVKVQNIEDLVSNPMVGEVQSNDLYGGIQMISWANEQVGDVTVRDPNTSVTVRGTVTSVDQFGPIESYLQDSSGGILNYGPAAEYVLDCFEIDDEIMVAGYIRPYYGRAEFMFSVTIETGDQTGHVAPRRVTVSQIGPGTENILIEIGDVEIDGEGDTYFTGIGPGGNNYYEITDPTTTGLFFYMDKDTGLIGQPIPMGSINMRGIGGQYNGGVPNTGFFISPRSTGDLDVTLEPTPTQRPMTTGVDDWEQVD